MIPDGRLESQGSGMLRAQVVEIQLASYFGGFHSQQKPMRPCQVCLKGGRHWRPDSASGDLAVLLAVLWCLDFLIVHSLPVAFQKHSVLQQVCDAMHRAGVWLEPVSVCVGTLLPRVYGSGRVRPVRRPVA